MHGRGRESEKRLLYFGCDFSGCYNFGKTIKIVAARSHILKLKCTKFDFGWGSAPDRAGELTQLPGPTSKEKEGKRREAGREGKERA